MDGAWKVAEMAPWGSGRSGCPGSLRKRVKESKLYRSVVRSAGDALRVREDGVGDRKRDAPSASARLAVKNDGDADRPEIGREAPDVAAEARDISRPAAVPRAASPNQRLNSIKKVRSGSLPRPADRQSKQRAR